MKYAIAAASMLILPVLGSVASASPCAHDSYQFQGSIIELSVCDNAPLELTYREPAPGLERHGIRPGTRLFIGRDQGGGRLGGIAKVIKDDCGAMNFPARGWIEAKRIVLRGRAPVRNGACEVVRTREEVLVLTLTATPPLPPRPVGRDRPGPGRTAEPGSGNDTGNSEGRPSFACAAPRRMNPAETAICASGALADLDRRMARTYVWLRGRLRGDERRRLKQDQRDWLVNVRDRCGDDAACLRTAYLDRTAALEEWLPPGR